MATVVLAGLSAAIGVGAASLTLFGLGAVGSFFAAFAIGAGLSLVSQALAPKLDLGTQMGGRSVMTREAAQSRKIVYGRARIGGNIVYLESTGTDNKYLYLVIAVAGHEIDAYEEVWFNDEKVWDGGNFTSAWKSPNTASTSPYVDLSFHLGNQTAADSGLVTASATNNGKWTNDHKLLDTAYMVVRLKHDVDKFAQGLPNISTVIRGKKVLDPSNNSTAWSQNPALCIYDYLRDTKYGLGESAANILTSSVTTAKGVCDEAVSLAAGGTQPRYTIDGVVDTASSIKSNIETMTGSMIGRLIYSGGKFEIHAGEYVAPTITIDESMAVGEISVQTKQSRRNAFNGVKGVFVSEDDNYIVSDYPAQQSKTTAGNFEVTSPPSVRYKILEIGSTNFTLIGASSNTVGLDFTATGAGTGDGVASLFLAEDGEPIYLDMPLPFTINNIRAQRIAKLALLRSRQQEAIIIPCNLTALKFKIGDNISVTNTRIGYSGKVFEVVGYSMAFNAGQMVVNVEAIETASSIWNWQTSDEEVFLGGGEVDLYDGKVAQPPSSVTVAGDTFIAADGTTSSFFNVTWPTSVDAFVDRYVVEWAITEAAGSLVVGKSYEILTKGNTAWTGIGAASNTNGVIFTATGVGAGDGIAVRSDNYLSQETRLSPFVITNIESLKVYYVRVKAINELGVSSVYKAASQTAAIDTTPPGVPTNPAAHGEYRQITVSWTPPTQTDFEEVDVFRAESLADMQSESGTYKDVGSNKTALIDTDLDTPREYFYKIRSSDRSKNKSDFTAIISATSKNVNITAPDNPDVIIYDGESGLPPSVTSARATLDTNTSTFYLKQDYKESLKLNLSYPVGALTSGSVSGQTNAINSTMAAFKFQVFYAPTSDASNFTQLGADIISGRKTTTGQLISNYFVKTTDLGSGNFRADLQTQSQVQGLFNSLDGSSLGIIDDNYNLRETLVAYDFPAGEYVFKVVVTVTNGSASSYPSTGSPSATLKRSVDAVGYKQFKKTGFTFALKPLYQPITIFREEGSEQIVRLSEGADTLELSAVSVYGKPRLIMVQGKGPSANPIPTVWGSRMVWAKDHTTYSNGTNGDFLIGLSQEGNSLNFSKSRGNPSLSELRISSGRTDIKGTLFLTDANGNTTQILGGGVGTITNVIAGTNLNGGGTSGAVTLDLDSTISGNHTFSNNLVIGGNLTVNGTTTTVDTDNLNVKDKNITLNYSTGDSSSSANGAGITIQDAVDASNNATILWNTSGDKFDFSHQLTAPSLNVGGNIAVTGTVDGVDIASRNSVLTTTTNTANAALPKSGGTMTGNLDVGGAIEFNSLSGTGSVSITDILDQDNMSSNSATALATQQSIKAYVLANINTGSFLPLSGGSLTGTLSSNSNIETTLDMKSRILYSKLTNNSYLDLNATDNVALNASAIVSLTVGGATKFQVRSTGALVFAGSLMMGSNATVVIDASRNLTNIGTINSSGNATFAGEITANGGIALGDNDKATFGADDNLKIYHDGSNARLNNATGAFNIQANDIHITDASNTAIRFQIDHDGATTSYYNGSPKLATTSTGIDVTGNIDMPDNGKLLLGASDDLQLYHDGGNSYVKESGNGALVLQSNGTAIVLEKTDGENMLLANVDGAVQIYYNGSSKLATTATGISVTGNIANASGDLTLDVAGNIILDADGGFVAIKDGGTEIGNLGNSSSNFAITSAVQDKDIVFKGNDNGTIVTALTLDMSAAGAATFNSSVSAGSYKVGSTTVIDASRNLTNIGVINSNTITINGASSGNEGGEIVFAGAGSNEGFNVDNFAGIFRIFDGSSPAVRLSLDTGGNATFAGTVLGTSVQGGSGSVTTPIGTVRAHGTSTAYVSASKGSETAFMGVDSSGYAMFGALTNHDAVIRANNVEYLRILTSGNIQIRSGALQMNSTTVIDASRNITAGTVSATGATTLNGAVTIDNALSITGASAKINIGGQQVFSSSRNMTNIGTISSGNITAPKFIMTGGSQIGQDYAYLKSNSTSNASLTLRKTASGADSIDFLQLRNNANGLIGKIEGDGDISFKNATLSGTINSGAITSTGNIETTLDMKARILYSKVTNNSYLDLNSANNVALNSSGAVNLTVGGATKFQARSTGALVFAGSLMMGSNATVVIDASRNLTNIGTITSAVAGTILDSSHNLTNINNVYASGYRIGSTTVIDSSKVVQNVTGINLLADAANNANDASLYIRKTNNNDWGLFINGTGSAYEYGIQVNLNGTHNFAFRGMNNNAQYFRVGTDMLLHTAEIRGNSFSVNGTTVIDSSRNITTTGEIIGGLFKVGSTTVLDGSRNLTNIGTIGSGAITSSNFVSGSYLKIAGNAFISRNPGNTNGSLWLAALSNGTGTANTVSISGGSNSYATFNSLGAKITQGGLTVGNQEVVTSGRNLTNIGTINSGAIVVSSAGGVAVSTSLENGTAQFKTLNANTATPSEQFYVGNNLADVDLGNKRGALKFFTGTTEKMRINGDGNVDIKSGGLRIGTYSTTATGSLFLTGSTANKQAELRCTNGNLHMDANSGNGMYLNYYSGGSIFFGNGAAGSNASILANGNFSTVGTIASGAITSSGIQKFTKSVYGSENSENYFRIKLQDQGGVHNDVGIGQTQTGNMGFNVTSGQEFIFNLGTSGHAAWINSAGVDAKVGGFRINGTTVIDASRNLTNIGTIASTHFYTIANVSGTGQGGALIPTGKRLGFDQSGVRSWTQYAAGGNLLFASGDGNGAIQANNFTASTYKIGTTTVIDASRNLTNIGSTISIGTTAVRLINGPFVAGNIGLQANSTSYGVYLQGGNVVTYAYFTNSKSVLNRRMEILASTSQGSTTPNIKSKAQGSGNGVTQYHINFTDSSGTVDGRITSNGYGTSYATTSDYRVKEDVQPMASATATLLALNPVNFKWVAGDARTDGFLAHEVSELVPDAVVGEKDATEEITDDEGVTTTVDSLQALDQAKLVPLLVKTIQELEARITALESA